MKAKDKFGLLKGTTARHAEFHRSRIMFCLKESVVEVAEVGSVKSHIEWFESEGWLTEANAEQFLEKNVRGFYLPDSNELYCYKGTGWHFDNEVLNELLEKTGELKRALCLNEATKVNLGLKDAVINGVSYRQFFIGTLKDCESRPKRSSL